MSDVLTSIEAIGEYMPYPPYISRERIYGYEKNLKRFKGTYNDGKFIRIKNLNGGVDRFPIITENYFKLITLKLQGLLLNEKPIISYKNDVNLSKILNDVIDDSGFWRAFLAAFRNFSALGTGVLYLSCNEQGPVVNSVNPGHLFKIVNPQNIDEIECYILVQPIFKVNYKEYSYTQIEKLRVLYHFKGYYIEKIFKYNENGQILNCESEQRYETGLTDFAVFCFENCPPTDEVFGYSDYDAISDIVLLYEQTLTLVNAVLIKNINPILQVPTGTFTENEQTGKLEAPTDGQAVEVDSGAAELKYINYDLQITDIMNYLTSLLNELGIQSEMSKTFLTGEFAANLSGEAIKSLLKSPMDKISRSIDELDFVVKALFVQMLHLVGIECSVSDVVITWRDGIAGTTDDVVNTAPEPTEIIETDEGGVLSE